MAWEKPALYQPGQKSAYKISRSKIDLFLDCPRCFWLVERLKIKRPNTPPFNINMAIDELFKAEFDTYRKDKEPHPIMVAGGVDAIPFSHTKLDEWRHNFTGVQRFDEASNMNIFGAVDDIWVTSSGELLVVDYKATSKKEGVSLDAEWQMSYKRQLEVYQWLLRGNGFEVSNTGYFVYTNADSTAPDFKDVLKFETKLIPYTGSDAWIEPTLLDIKKCLEGDIAPVGKGYMNNGCEYCMYAKSRTELTLQALQKKK